MAASKVVVEGASVTGPQWKELVRQVVDNELNCEQVQAIIEHRNPFELVDSVVKISTSYLGEAEAQLESWRVLYREYGIELGEVKIPERKPGFDRLIVVAKGLTNNQVYDWCQKKFGCWKYTDDLNSVTNDRNTAKSYAIWVRERVEADEELKNLSANQLKKKQVNGITLLERLLYELKYFAETGKHLDIENWTLCSGSRYSDGDVPFVRWFPDHAKLDVDWAYRGRRSSNLRSREAVS